MNRCWQTLLGLGAGLLVAGYTVTSLTGCANAAPASSRPAASELKEGVNILKADDPAWGVNAAYVKAGRVVYIESRVGQLKPEVYRLDSPNEPQYEMDYRFVDQDNHTFLAQRGGDNFADPTWNAEVTASRHLPPAAYAHRVDDFRLATEAAGALAKALPKGFEDHAFHMSALAAQPSIPDDVRLQTQAAVIAAEPTIEARAAAQQAYGTDGYGSWSIFNTNKYSKPTVEMTWFYAASHSAAYMGDYEGYYSSGEYSGTWNVIGWVWMLSACNHGTCYNGGNGIGYDCYSQAAGWTYATSITGSTAGGVTGANDGLGGCQTAYNWDSGVGSHLCNDDAAYELWQAKNNNPGSDANGGSNTGGGHSFDAYMSSHCRGSLCGSSPSWFSCGQYGPSGDWNTPNCP
ncbi:MAG TPA: hypothetical protein VGL81_07480 [Polyangiaceae bacterium]|jgi:hypothetical protein